MGPQQDYNSFPQYPGQPGQPSQPGLYPGPQGQDLRPQLTTASRFFDLWPFLFMLPAGLVMSGLLYASAGDGELDSGKLLLFLGFYLSCAVAGVGLIGCVVALIRGIFKWTAWSTWLVLGVVGLLCCITWVVMLFQGYGAEYNYLILPTGVGALICLLGTGASVIGLVFSAGVRTE